MFWDEPKDTDTGNFSGVNSYGSFIGGTFQQDCYPEEISLKQAIGVFAASVALVVGCTFGLRYQYGSRRILPAGSQGKGGLWSNWNVIFVEQKTGRNLLVAVRQGRMAYTKEL